MNGIFDFICKNSLFSGFMFGVSYLIQYLTYGLIFFLAAVYISSNDLEIDGSIQSIYLIFFAGISAGNQSSFLQDFAKAKVAAKEIFKLLDL